MFNILVFDLIKKISQSAILNLSTTFFTQPQKSGNELQSCMLFYPTAQFWMWNTNYSIKTTLGPTTQIREFTAYRHMFYGQPQNCQNHENRIAWFYQNVFCGTKAFYKQQQLFCLGNQGILGQPHHFPTNHKNLRNRRTKCSTQLRTFWGQPHKFLLNLKQSVSKPQSMLPT